MSDQKTIHERLIAVSKDLGAIGKDQTAGSGKWSYQFRGIDQVMNNLHPVLVSHEVHMTTQVEGVESDWTLTGRDNDKKTRMVGLTLRVTFWGPDGDSTDSVSYAEAWDTSDKASNKAMSTALRYALIQTFCIPTEEEHETSHHEAVPGPVDPPHGKIRVAQAKQRLLEACDGDKAKAGRLWMDAGWDGLHGNAAVDETELLGVMEMAPIVGDETEPFEVESQSA